MTTWIRCGVLFWSVLFVTVAGCHDGQAAGDAEKGTPAIVGVQTAQVTKGPFTETLGAIGTVVPRPGHVAALAAPQAARISQVYVTAGQHVTQGEPLVELDQTPFRAATEAAEATLAAAEKANERQQRLATEGIVPRKDADQAAAEAAKARADAGNARRAEQLSVVRAPLGGVVTRMTAVLGSTADVAQPLVEVADPAALDILLNVTPNDAARLRRGAKVTLTAGQNATGDALGVGSVIDIGGTVDTSSRSVNVRVQAPTTRRPLRISETVFGQIAVTVHPNAIVVPLEALVPDGEDFKVFVVDAAGMAHERKVSIGGRTDKVAEITQGLTGDERVVTYGAYGVSDSAKVVPAKQAATPAASDSEKKP
ncbi:MAG TPA: efflux RND transporter periplasmic adaptor subunit [Gemmatimonadaceae bacterium]|jgi:RND family efflux transporter MFP subunit